MNAQVFMSNGLMSTHDIALPSNLEEYTQKTLPYNDSISIVFTKYTSGHHSTFCLIRRGQTIGGGGGEDVYCSALSRSFHLNDFAILGDKLYFCGDVLINGSQTAFIAYTDISNFLPPPVTIPPTINNNNIKYTLFKDIHQDSIYTISRIEAYYDEDAEVTKIAGIGKMYYGKPPAWRINPEIGELELEDPNNFPLDFFMVYTVDEKEIILNSYDMALDSTLTPIQAFANKTEMYYLVSDTASSYYRNRFMDIAQTDEDIYVLSADFFPVRPNIPYLHFAQFNVLKYPKDTLSQIESYSFRTPFNVHSEYGVKMTNIGNDYLAVSFVKREYYIDSNTDSTEAYVLKIKVSGDEFSIDMRCKFDSQGDTTRIRDIKYLEESNELVVLRETLLGELSRDMAFHIKMRDNISFPYTSKRYSVYNNINNDDIKWNAIVMSDDYNYTLSGCQRGYLMFFNRYYDAVVNPYCIDEQEFLVEKLDVLTTGTVSTLQKCTFSVLSPTVINYGELFIWYSDTDIYRAVINNFPMDALYNAPSRQNCGEED